MTSEITIFILWQTKILEGILILALFKKDLKNGLLRRLSEICATSYDCIFLPRKIVLANLTLSWCSIYKKMNYGKEQRIILMLIQYENSKTKEVLFLPLTHAVACARAFGHKIPLWISPNFLRPCQIYFLLPELPVFRVFFTTLSLRQSWWRDFFFSC